MDHLIFSFVAGSELERSIEKWEGGERRGKKFFV